MPEPMFYLTGVDNQSDAQVEFLNPGSPPAKVAANNAVTFNSPVLVPNILYNPPEEISVTTSIGTFYLRQWDDGAGLQLLSMLVNQGENVLAPPPPANVQLVVKSSGGLGVARQ